jgi:hypothetical protein
LISRSKRRKIRNQRKIRKGKNMRKIRKRRKTRKIRKRRSASLTWGLKMGRDSRKMIESKKNFMISLNKRWNAQQRSRLMTLRLRAPLSKITERRIGRKRA